MAQDDAAGKPIDGNLLGEILKRAKSDGAFRDRLLKTPKETLASLGIRADPKWIAFFHKLTASNFTTGIQHKIDNDPMGEAEV